MTKTPYFSPQSSQLREGEKQGNKGPQDSMTSGDGDQEAETTMGCVGGARGAVREDFPEEEIPELSLEG